MTQLLSLHRYWLFADGMREYYDKALLNPDWLQLAKDTKNDYLLVFWAHDPGMFMSYWYGSLYVVIEGWRELGLNEPAIDKLLMSPNVELLKRFRNGIFHFQQSYFDNRFLELMGAQDSVAWVHELNKAFGNYFSRHPG